MIIAHIATTLSGGAGIGLQRYHRALLDAGINSRLVLATPPSVPSPEVDVISRARSRVLTRFARRAGLSASSKDQMVRKLASLDRLADSQPKYELFSIPFSDFSPESHPWVKDADVVNLHWVSGVLDWPRFFKSINKPVVITLHDQQPYLGGFHYSLDVKENPHLGDLELEVKLVKKNAVANHRLAVIANSQWNARRAKESGFFKSNVPIETIYYPLDTSVFQPRAKSCAKETFGINQDLTVIGFACENLTNTRKGFSDLLEAFAMLPDSLRDRLTVLSFGKTPDMAICEKLSIPWVHLGFLNAEIAQAAAYSAMDIFVIPSRAEAFGQTALEAIACGTRVIGSKAGGIREALLNSPNSLLYDPGDIGELTNCLTTAIKEKSFFVSEPVYTERIRKSHSFSQCADSHIKVYSQLLA